MAQSRYVLGISAFYHDSAACLLRDGAIVAAAQEERFSRIKNDPQFPRQAIEYCLAEAGIEPNALAAVGFYDKPILKFERLVRTYLSVAPAGLPSFVRVIPLWVRQKLRLPKFLKNEAGFTGPIYYADHHESHAASAFFPSPFNEAAILTIDGVGEWTTTAMGVGRGTSLELTHEIRFPHSLGLLYSAFTAYLGFKVNSDEYKVMGAAPYGSPEYADLIRRELIDIKDDGSFRLNMEYFAFTRGERMFNPRVEALFGGPSRDPKARLTQRDWNIAASVQRVTEDAILAMCRTLHARTGDDALCLAGGVALNCVANGRIVRETPFRKLFVQPAAGDAGGALGAAMVVEHVVLGQPRRDPMSHALFGPAYSDADVRRVLAAQSVPWRELPEAELLRATASLIAAGRVVGWFQGRLEFGPRALGNRSILADPRSPTMRDQVNRKIKFREGFRPFAPAVLDECLREYFELDQPSPFMLLVAQVRSDRRIIPAVTHVDGSARIQTVTEASNPRFYGLIRAFAEQTGVPILLNTSFNVRDQPIVCTPAEGFDCFMRTDMDALVLGNHLVCKPGVEVPAVTESRSVKGENLAAGLC
jgi:carbamoyltransferase